MCCSCCTFWYFCSTISLLYVSSVINDFYIVALNEIGKTIFVPLISFVIYFLVSLGDYFFFVLFYFFLLLRLVPNIDWRGDVQMLLIGFWIIWSRRAGLDVRLSKSWKSSVLYLRHRHGNPLLRVFQSMCGTTTKTYAWESYMMNIAWMMVNTIFSHLCGYSCCDLVILFTYCCNQ